MRGIGADRNKFLPSFQFGGTVKIIRMKIFYEISELLLGRPQGLANE